MKKLFFLLVLTLFVYGVQTGVPLRPVLLDGINGGKSDGKAWDSHSLLGKVHTILYMDPDERKEAMPFLDALNSQNFDTKKYATVAIVNLAATWMPDAVLEAILSKKQKELNNTEFIFDKTKYLLEKWKLKDNASNVLIINAQGKLLYQNSAKLSSEDIEEIMNLISKNIDMTKQEKYE